MNTSNRSTKTSAYLWARCEGWARIGVYHAVIVDDAGGKVLDEKRNVLLRREGDGYWRSLVEKGSGMGFDQIAVTHLPVDPGKMGREDWQERLKEEEGRRRSRMEERKKRIQMKKPKQGDPKPSGEGDSQGDLQF